MIVALGDPALTLHQIAAALGLVDEDLDGWIGGRAETVAAPASLRAGDVIVRTQVAAALTMMRVEQPYRRPAGASGYTAAVSIRGRIRTLAGPEISEWFPVKVLRSAPGA